MKHLCYYSVVRCLFYTIYWFCLFFSAVLSHCSFFIKTSKSCLFFLFVAKPFFIHPLQDMHVDVNSQLTWRCETVARPRATFTWFKDSQPITSIPGKIEINSNVLKMYNLQPSDSGMYQCNAYNVYGSVFSGAQLRVLCKLVLFASSICGYLHQCKQTRNASSI